MADVLLGSSQLSLLQLHTKLGFPKQGASYIQRLQFHKTNRSRCLVFSSDQWQRRHKAVIAARVLSPDSTKSFSTVIASSVDSTDKGINLEPEIGGGGGEFGSSSGGGGGGGSGGGGGGDGEGEEASDDSQKKMVLSMSQKLTLGYAFLVGVGGLMGYMKSGSQKSLLAGGVSAAVLFYVFRELPTNPVLASSIGIVMSAALTGVMGSRFLRSRKIFPAGVVSLVSFVMTGGYLHGIMRSLH